MDFSLREWLILIGVIIIIGILVDGFRRYRKSQVMRVYEDDDYEDPEERQKEALLRRELPNGGARPVHRSVESADPVMNAFENARKTPRSPLTEMPHKVDSGPELDRHDRFELDELASLVPDRFDTRDAASIRADKDYSDPLYDGYDDLDVGRDVQPNFGHEEPSNFEIEEPAGFSREQPSFSRKEPSRFEQDDYSGFGMDPLEEEMPQEEYDDDEQAEIEEVIVINVFAPQHQPFAGMELLQLVLNCGMRYGDMDIFHRHEEGFDRGKIQFSMANAIEPGTFNLDTMGESESPGVSFFMGLPGPKNSMKAFDFMLETAQALVRNLGGELRDERRSPMSEQTIAHCRQRIRDFERRQLSKMKRSK